MNSQIGQVATSDGTH